MTVHLYVPPRITQIGEFSDHFWQHTWHLCSHCNLPWFGSMMDYDGAQLKLGPCCVGPVWDLIDRLKGRKIELVGGNNE